jgi:HEAT repeat protein
VSAPDRVGSPGQVYAPGPGDGNSTPGRSTAGNSGAPPDANACISYLVRSLSDDAALVRHAAAGALGAIGDRAATAALIARLKDRHPAVRAAAVFALGRIADPAAAAALQDSIRTDPDESVRAAAAEAAKKLQGVQTQSPK